MLRNAVALMILVALPLQVLGHGMMMEPVNRGSRWRVDPTATPDYNDNAAFCGGFAVQYDINGGKCGLCGDSYSDPLPRAHELGGTYGQGVIVRNYLEGSAIPAQVRLTANHKGYFEFRICNLDKFGSESEECFDDVYVPMSSGDERYLVGTSLGEHYMDLQLPIGLVCEHCVLQWRYITGNRWGKCDDGTSGNGCGPQENFRTCSDISISAI